MRNLDRGEFLTNKFIHHAGRPSCWRETIIAPAQSHMYLVAVPLVAPPSTELKNSLHDPFRLSQRRRSEIADGSP